MMTLGNVFNGDHTEGLYNVNGCWTRPQDGLVQVHRAKRSLEFPTVEATELGVNSLVVQFLLRISFRKKSENVQSRGSRGDAGCSLRR